MPSLPQVILSAALLGQAAAHTWIDQMSVIGSNGSFVGDYGYIRNYTARTDPGFTGDSNLWLLPPDNSINRLRINGSDLLCSDYQRTQKQSSSWPRLSAAPGDYVAMKYTENGHVTLPWNQPGKPEKGGTTFMFATTQPKTDEKILDVLQWTEDGSGGDKRGTLLAANNYDDGRCHQINGGNISTARQEEFPDPIPGQAGSHNELFCESNFRIPTDQSVGQTLTIYWVWEWPTAPNTTGLADGKDEWYTNCADIDIVASSKVKTYLAEGSEQKYPLTQQDPEQDAVSDYKSRTALTSTPVVFNADGSTIPFSVASTVINTVMSSEASASAMSTPASTPAYSSAVATSAASSTTAPESSQANAASSHVQGGSMKTVFLTTTVQPVDEMLTTMMVTVTASVPTTQSTVTTTIKAKARRQSTSEDACELYQACLAEKWGDCTEDEQACNGALSAVDSNAATTSTSTSTESVCSEHPELRKCVHVSKHIGIPRNTTVATPRLRPSYTRSPSPIVVERTSGAIPNLGALKNIGSFSGCVAMIVIGTVAIIMS